MLQKVKSVLRKYNQDKQMDLDFFIVEMLKVK